MLFRHVLCRHFPQNRSGLAQFSWVRNENSALNIQIKKRKIQQMMLTKPSAGKRCPATDWDAGAWRFNYGTWCMYHWCENSRSRVAGSTEGYAASRHICRTALIRVNTAVSQRTIYTAGAQGQGADKEWFTIFSRGKRKTDWLNPGYLLPASHSVTVGMRPRPNHCLVTARRNQGSFNSAAKSSGSCWLFVLCPLLLLSVKL